MNFFSKLSKKNLASDNIWKQIFGALTEWNPKFFWAFVLLVFPVSMGIARIVPPGSIDNGLKFICLNLIIWFIIKICVRLIDVFNLRKQETAITWSYITILASIGLWIIGFILIFKINQGGRVAAAVGVVGTLIGWIFKDKINGVIAFLHLRSHHLLKSGDWIKVEKLGVDGEVQRMTLTSVTIYNWDTTTSTIPISALQSEHFINLQNMSDGKTYGRRMLKTFVLDTGWFRVLSADEIKRLKDKLASSSRAGDLKTDAVLMNLDRDEIDDEGVLNARLYRTYIYHWLMNHSHVSQYPRLMVRWMDQKDGGMQLQVYAFLVDSSLAQFEWQQSQIIEHIIKSLDWFGLRLYQSPSAYDVSNSNIYLTGTPADNRKELVYD